MMGMGGGQGGGHMVRCPLCGGTGETTPDKAAAVAPMMQQAGGEMGADPAAALAAAMTSRPPRTSGGRGGGHGGGHGGM